MDSYPGTRSHAFVKTDCFRLASCRLKAISSLIGVSFYSRENNSSTSSKVRVAILSRSSRGQGSGSSESNSNNHSIRLGNGW